MRPFSRPERVTAWLLAAIGAAAAAAAGVRLAHREAPADPPVSPPPPVDRVPAEMSVAPPDYDGPVGQIRGLVQDEARGRVAGATVELYELTGAARRAAAGFTRAAGEFAFLRVPSGHAYCVAVRAPGYAPAVSETMVLPPEKAAERVLTLSRGANVVWRVVRGSAGSPVADASIRIQRKTAAADPGVSAHLPVAEATTGADGSASMPLAPGSYAVQVGAPGPPWVHRAFEHPTQTAEPLVLQLP
jgi:hypothetical protein